MAKTRYFSISGRKFNSKELGTILTESAKDAMESQMDEQVERIVVELNNLLYDLNLKTSNRGRGFYAVRYNAPFEDAEIHVRKRRNSNGDLSYTIRVNNDRFNILDQGAPARKAKPGKPFKFPRYKGTLTSENSTDLSSVPVKIMDQRTVKGRQVAFIRDDLDIAFGMPGVRNPNLEGWAQVNEVAEIKPRNFIVRLADRVRNSFRGRPGVRAGFVKISVRKS